LRYDLWDRSSDNCDAPVPNTKYLVTSVKLISYNICVTDVLRNRRQANPKLGAITDKTIHDSFKKIGLDVVGMEYFS